MPTVYGWFLRRTFIQFNLVYRGSRDGFTSKSFHEKVDGIRGLFFVIKSAEYGKVFGGYTEVPWSTPKSDSQYFYDYRAFIFSISHRTKHLQCLDEFNAVQHFSKDNLFAFGFGDFGIRENCDQRDDNWSNFGCTKWTKHSFQIPYNMKTNSDEAYRYLAGAHLYRVAEIEVYQVKLEEQKPVY